MRAGARGCDAASVFVLLDRWSPSIPTARFAAGCGPPAACSAVEREQRPAAVDAAQLAHAALLEAEAGADHGAVDGPRHEHLSGCRERRDARGDVHGHAADVVADHLALAGVET